MSRIRILTENLANQIAAGEVVERPASVVKELVENAIDAGASRIAVQVEGAGTRMIRVIDNGCGMDQDDALLCLERHATSKLRTADDLVKLRTLGFRGEAIPSIASVARFVITTKAADAALGCRVDVRFGAVHSIHEMGCAQGTVVEVADLFANVPARRKFLKSANTELAHIDEVIRSYALVRYQTGFTYQVNGREVIDLPSGDESPERRVRQVLGDCPGLIPIDPGDAAAARAEIRITGHLVPPDQMAGGRAGRLWTFVNGRYIKDRMVNHAVAEGMQGFLMKGGRPAGVVNITLPPEAVDVNVHPTKQEVRFREGNVVHNKIVAAVWRGLEAYQERLKGEIFGPPRKEVALPPILPAEVEEKVSIAREAREAIARPAAVPPANPAPASRSGEAREERLVRPSPSTAAVCESREPQPLPFLAGRANRGMDNQEVARPRHLEEAGAGAKPAETRPPASVAAPVPAASATNVDPAPPSVEPRPIVRYLGQLLDTYLLCEIDDGLVAIDQHAVQERLIFEEMKRHYAAATMPSQILLFPAMVELLPTEIEALEGHGPDLARLGLEVQSFGGDTVVIKAVPAALAHQAPAEILRGVLGRFVEGQNGPGAARLEEVLAGMACKAAIKAGHRLTEREVQHLLDRMHAAGIFSHCPHGRPVLKRFSKYEIERWFQRV